MTTYCAFHTGSDSASEWIILDHECASIDVFFDRSYGTGAHTASQNTLEGYVGRTTPVYRVNVDTSNKRSTWLFEVAVPRWLQFDDDYMTELEISILFGGDGMDISSQISAPIIALTDKRDVSFSLRVSDPTPRIFPGPSTHLSSITPSSVADTYSWNWESCESEIIDSWSSYTEVKELKMVVKNDPILTNAITVDVYSLSDPLKRIARCVYDENSGTFDSSRQLYIQFGHYWYTPIKYTVDSIAFQKKYANASYLPYIRSSNNDNWNVEMLYANCSDHCYSFSDAAGSLLVKASEQNERNMFALEITLPLAEGAYFDMNVEVSIISINTKIADISGGTKPWIWCLADAKGKHAGIKLLRNHNELIVYAFSNDQEMAESSGVYLTKKPITQAFPLLDFTVSLLNFDMVNKSILQFTISNGETYSLDVRGSFATHSPIAIKLLRIPHLDGCVFLSVFD